MSTARVKQQPLLYIAQPKTAKPILNAQTTYTIPRNARNEEKEPAEAKNTMLNQLPSELKELIELNQAKTADQPVPEAVTVEAEREEDKTDEETITLEITETAIQPVPETDAPAAAEIEPESIPLAASASQAETVKEVPASPATEKTNPPIQRRERGLRRVKPFRSMTVSEKIGYLVNFPKQLPPVTCSFTTSDYVYTGIFMNQVDDEVEIKLPNGELTSIKTDSIRNIKMQVH
ncbi:CotO family spore coat protein [Mesobacillus foraminis]|uniref:Spore coat protein CotO n=1 Tax=Mesobacillus foraminis TaxID=279826 RepID=A0A4R2BM75_9BACI|nr:CotO family spore coat protein [Mesobacillus foraminis]TCN27825.1 spore coat protein CotO [Mesobacillus foraminis]